MRKSRFLISSLAAAGFVKSGLGGSTPALGQDEARPPIRPQPAIFNRYSQEHLFHLASHASHSSHASHASHASHRSGSSGYSFTPYAPAQTYSPPPPAPVTTPKTLPGNASTFTRIVQQVQLGLKSFGYYSGAIDGVVGPQMRTALTKFQDDYNLKKTGTITPEVLDALNVSAR